MFSLLCHSTSLQGTIVIEVEWIRIKKLELAGQKAFVRVQQKGSEGLICAIMVKRERG